MSLDRSAHRSDRALPRHSCPYCPAAMQRHWAPLECHTPPHDGNDRLCDEPKSAAMSASRGCLFQSCALARPHRPLPAYRHCGLRRARQLTVVPWRCSCICNALYTLLVRSEDICSAMPPLLQPSSWRASSSGERSPITLGIREAFSGVPSGVRRGHATHTRAAAVGS
jgi:hypothetical protein